MGALEALSADYLMQKAKSLRELSKNRSTALMSEGHQESRSDVFFDTERRLMGLDCQDCNNTGVRVFQRGSLQYSTTCACMAVYNNNIRIKKSGLGRTFTDCTFDKYVATDDWQKSIKNKALQFLEDADKWFYIGGAVGSGKSHICTAICTELIKRKPVYFMPWRDEIVRLKANVMKDEVYQEIIYKPKTIETLYIDDFFKGSVGHADINAAFEILNYRYNNRLTTIISSEYDLDKIIEIDEATGSRIYQMSKGYNLRVPNDVDKNYRLN